VTLSPPTFPALAPIPAVESRPVFVDGTGRRLRLLRWAAVGLAATFTAYLAVLGVAVGAGSVDPVTSGLPLSGVVAPLVDGGSETSSAVTPTTASTTSRATATRTPTRTTAAPPSAPVAAVPAPVAAVPATSVPVAASTSPSAAPAATSAVPAGAAPTSEAAATSEEAATDTTAVDPTASAGPADTPADPDGDE
jgi:hypothetical protein